MQDLSLHLPAFSRVYDYCGLWCIEASAAHLLYSVALSMDMREHVEQASVDPPACAMELVGTPGGTIADIRISGLMMKGSSSMGGTSTIQARREIRKAAADQSIAGILLSIDSPGGTVSGTSELAADVRSANKIKPVWAYAEDTMASAAYWTGSQASRIVANTDTALIGSIGAIQVIHDISSLTEQKGIKTLVFATGPLKGLGTPGSKVTDEQAAHVQGLIDGVQESFDAAVKQGRGMSVKELAAVRHGGVLRAPDALNARLIDAIGSKDRVLSEFSRALKAPKEPKMESKQIGVFPMLPRAGLPTLKRA